nr:DUF2927 domain-containing protein [Nereida sp. MMG025]
MAISGCAAPVTPVPFPKERPAGLVPPPPPPPPARAARSRESFDVEKYYARLQEDLLVRGLLRRDGGGPDVPYTARNLVENFTRIAFFDEYSSLGDTMVARERAVRLRKWDQPVRMQVEFGASVDARTRAHDLPRINDYAKRLSRVSRLPITMTNVDPNYHVMVLNEDDRRRIGPRLRELVPGISKASVRAVETMPRSTLCLVLAFAETDTSKGYAKAVAIIRGEHPDLLRWSCVHEEVAQGLGLANDSPAARPSIFNDDEEFALLTTHDEMLLRMLYDRRLRNGMSAQEARPILEQIAQELTGGAIN